MMKSFVFACVMAFSCSLLIADSPCYYFIMVSGKADCYEKDGCDCDMDFLEPEVGCGIYYTQNGSFVPVCDAISDWSFNYTASNLYAFFCTTTDLLCELAGEGSEPSDPNFYDCDGSGPSMMTIEVDNIYSEACGCPLECGSFSVQITRLCGCDEFWAYAPGCGCSDDPNEMMCSCSSDLDDSAQDDIDDKTGGSDDPDPGTAKPPVTGNDPVVFKSGKLTASVTDITVPGRLMDINFSRTYNGDAKDIGFLHTYKGLWENYQYRLTDEPRPYVTGYDVYDGYVDLITQVGYEFYKITNVDYTFDTDVFNTYIADPEDPNTPPDDYGKVSFEDYDSGMLTVTYTYSIFANTDPNANGTLIAHLTTGTFSKTFEYDLSPRTGRLGRKWYHNYDISLEKLYDPNEANPDRYILNSGGKQLLYTQQSDAWGFTNKFDCPSATNEVLFIDDNDLFELSKKGGISWHFNSDLRIGSIEDLNGNALTFSYSNDRLYQVTNDNGGYIRFYYDSFNMIDYITDSFGRTWNYNRDIHFDLTEVVKPITGSTGSITNEYTYDSDHNLLTMTDGADQTWHSNTYTNGRITSQLYGSDTFDNTYYFDTADPNIVEYVYTTDRSGNAQAVHLTETGLIRKRMVYLTGQTAVTQYTYDFDATGEEELESPSLVTKIEMSGGDIYEYEYDNWDNVSAVIHKASESDSGRRTQFTYSQNVWSLPLTMTDAAGNTTSFTYDTNYNLTKITLPQIEAADPNNPGSLQTLSPEYGFTYNSYGQVEYITLPDGISIRYYYNASGYVSSIVYDYGTSPGNLNITYTFTYDARGNIASVTDPDNITTSYSYDAINRLTEIADALNSKTKLEYNDAGLVAQAFYQLGTSYNENTAINTSFTYNNVDRLTGITDSLGRITQFTLDANDNISAIADPQGYVDGYSTAYDYNQRDQVQTITLPEDYDPAAGNQNITSIDYTIDGLVESVTDASGNTTDYYYSGYNDLAAISCPDDTFTEYRYDRLGNMRSERKRDGSFIYYNYDALGRLIDKAIDPNSGEDIIAVNHSLLSYLSTGTWAVTTDTECISGRYVSTTDPNATYTILGEKTGRFAVLIRYPSFTASSNANAKIEFGDRFNPTDTYYINQNYNTDQWLYIGVADFNSLPEVRICSNGSTDITSIDAVKFVPVRSFEYDITGRLTKSPANEFTYDRAGRLKTVTTGGREINYEYTAAGRKSKLTWPDGYYVNYGYDTVGRLNAITDSRGKTLWSCTYDAAGRRTQTTGLYGLTTNYNYEDVSPTAEDGRGIYLEGLYNTLGTLSLDYDYSRDLAGNITTENTEGTEIDYLYDKNYSLTDVDYQTGDDIDFNYDNLLNRTSVTEGAATTNYTLDSLGLNQFDIVGSANLDYDYNGNLIQHGTWHYLYDCENQLIAAYNLNGDPNEVSVSLYSYDDFGRRTAKAAATGVDATTGTTTESYLYDGFQVIAEYNTDNQHIKRRFIYAEGIDEPIAMIVEPDHQGWYGLEEYSAIADSWLCDPNDAAYDAAADYIDDDIINVYDFVEFITEYYLIDRPPPTTTKYYGYVFDGMNNVVAMTYMNDPNETGNPNETPYFIETYSYDAFGTVNIYDPNSIPLTQSAIGNPYMFTGRRYDNESGLYYYRFRMYNPNLGRFVQADPIGYYDSMNLYQYCLNNPINFIDPFGLSLWDEIVFVAKGGFSGHSTDVVNELVSGFLDGIDITINGLGLGIPDKIGFTNSSQKIKENGGYGRASDIAATISGYAAWSALGVGVADKIGLIDTSVQSNNLFRVMSKPLKRGFRIDRPHHEKWFHCHYWKW